MKKIYFNLLHNSHPTVPMYADGCELLVSGGFLTSARSLLHLHHPDVGQGKVGGRHDNIGN